MKNKVLSLILLASSFILVDALVFGVFTYRVSENYSSTIKSKSIEVNDYIPFSGEKVIKYETDFKLEDNLPVIDGATALLPIFSSIVENVYPRDSVKFENGNFLENSAIQFSNTVGAYKNIADKKCDIGLLSGPSSEQIEYARSKGVEFELTPIGREAFVFIVNKNNPINELTTQEVKDIFSRKITNWKEVGGTFRPISPIQRAQNSGSQTRMEKFMDGVEMKVNPFAVFGGAIGYSFRYYVESLAEHGDVKLIALDGVSPTRDNIRNNTYPCTSSFYAVTRKNETNPNVKKLLDFILSNDDQAIIEQVGYVGLH